jgi:hypothetical protein
LKMRKKLLKSRGRTFQLKNSGKSWGSNPCDILLSSGQPF